MLATTLNQIKVVFHPDDSSLDALRSAIHRFFLRLNDFMSFVNENQWFNDKHWILKLPVDCPVMYHPVF